jgi:general secretion pathway protein K
MKKFRQTGVAVVTALLLTTLAITIVASLFWQQQVQVRSIENQRFQLQKKWVLRGALDWARLILREDVRNSNNVDHLGEPWAVTLGDTHLDQYVENGKADTEQSEASLNGKITDAQSRFNLNNLAVNGVADIQETAVLARLLTNLRINPLLAQSVAGAVASTQPKPLVGGGEAGKSGTANPVVPPLISTDSAASSSEATKGVGRSANSSFPDAAADVQFLRFSQIDDLLSVSGFSPEMLRTLKDFIAVLPQKTTINLNTTSKEVMSACLNISLTDAAIIVAGRDRAYFRDLPDFENRFPGKITALNSKSVSFSTNYFFINGKVKLSRSALEVNALLERTAIASKVLWIREN